MARSLVPDNETVVGFDENECIGWSVTDERTAEGECVKVVTLRLIAGSVVLKGQRGVVHRRFSAADVQP